MGLIKRLFGSGEVKFQIETADGFVFNGKMPFEGQFDEKECVKIIVESFEYTHNKSVSRIRLVDAIGESVSGGIPYSGDWYARI